MFGCDYLNELSQFDQACSQRSSGEDHLVFRAQIHFFGEDDLIITAQFYEEKKQTKENSDFIIFTKESIFMNNHEVTCAQVKVIKPAAKGNIYIAERTLQ